MIVAMMMVVLASAAPPPAGPKGPVPIEAQNWITDADYPRAALRPPRQGDVAFRVTVDARGRVADCAVTASSGTAILDARVCELLHLRGHFAPARDADGRPVPSQWNSIFHWRLPEN
jgi:protein TonB